MCVTVSVAVWVAVWVAVREIMCQRDDKHIYKKGAEQIYPYICNDISKFGSIYIYIYIHRYISIQTM